jgi:putative MATE family efflux protein
MSEISLGNVSSKKAFFKLALPSIIGMLIVSMQMMIDGFFIANSVGASGLAAVNLSMPLVNFFMSVSMMICSGGAVYTSIELGRNNKEKANEIFSFTLLTYLIIIGISGLFTAFFIDKVVLILGADSNLIPHVKYYLLTLLVFNIFLNFPIFTETFVRVGGIPNFVFISSLICITGNILGDYILVYKLGLGTLGAAIATASANGLASFVLFFRFFKKRCYLSLIKPKGNFELLKKILYNGSSEMLTVISSAIATYIFNLILMKNIGSLGVSALTIVFYVNSILNICLYGLAQALQPLVSFNLGARRFDRIMESLKISLISGATLGIVFFITMIFQKELIINMFSKGDKALETLTNEVLRVVIFQYLFSFINVMASAFLTALEKPFESVVISLFRSLIFTVTFLFLLPKLLGNVGLWLSLPAGEFSCIFISIPLMFYAFKKINR